MWEDNIKLEKDDRFRILSNVYGAEVSLLSDATFTTAY